MVEFKRPVKAFLTTQEKRTAEVYFHHRDLKKEYSLLSEDIFQQLLIIHMNAELEPVERLSRMAQIFQQLIDSNISQAERIRYTTYYSRLLSARQTILERQKLD